MYRPAALVTGIFLIIIAGIQLFRAIVQAKVTVAGVQVPVWVSWIAASVLALLAYSLLKERLRKD